MRISRKSFISLLLFAFLLHAFAQDPWKDFFYLQDGFSITLPASPIFSSKVLDTVAGKLDVHAYTLDLGGDRGFALNVIDYKIKGEMTPEKSKEVLQLAKNGAINDIKGKLVSESEVELVGHKGIEFDSESGNYHIHSRFYFANGKLYTIMAIVQ